jgi:hypothetical protein
MPKRTRQQREQHLRLIEKSLIEGMPTTELVALAAAKFQIGPRQAWKDIAEIKRRWAEAGLENRNHSLASLAMAVRRREAIYRTALRSGEPHTALDAEIDRCRLLGLYPAAGTKLEGNLNVQADLKAGVKFGDGTVKPSDVIAERQAQFTALYERLIDPTPLPSLPTLTTPPTFPEERPA